MLSTTGSADQLTAETAQLVQFAVVDGNHRLNAARQGLGAEVLGAEARVPCHVYKQFTSQAKRIVANACNEASESLSLRTTFDRLFFNNELLSDLKGSLGRMGITVGDISKAFREVGVLSPCDSVLRQWKRAVDGMSEQTFRAFRSLNEVTDKRVDVASVILSPLSANGFMALKETPWAHVLLLHIVSRHRNRNKVPPRLADLGTFTERAKECRRFRAGIESLIPESDWTQELQTLSGSTRV